jgi:hypothetical protein
MAGDTNCTALCTVEMSGRGKKTHTCSSACANRRAPGVHDARPAARSLASPPVSLDAVTPFQTAPAVMDLAPANLYRAMIRSWRTGIMTVFVDAEIRPR